MSPLPRFDPASSAGVVTVSWNRTRLWPGNPRRRFDEASQRELADHICSNGVLENLVGREISPEAPFLVDQPGWEIVIGSRRWRAVERLVREGRVAPEYPLPARILDLDDNQALGLSGAQAALPIWTQFMTRALAGHANQAFDVPPGIVFVDIDRDTGQLASPGCPKVVREAFLPGTEPVEICHVHYSAWH